MFCENCGKKLSENARFCDACGTYLHDENMNKPNDGTGNPTYSGGAAYGEQYSSDANKQQYNNNQYNQGYNRQYGNYSPPPPPNFNGRAVNNNDNPSGWTAIGFVLGLFVTPVIGLVLWLIWKDECPKKAAAVGKGTLYALLTGVLLVVGIFALVIGSAVCASATMYSLTPLALLPL